MKTFADVANMNIADFDRLEKIVEIAGYNVLPKGPFWGSLKVEIVW